MSSKGIALIRIDIKNRLDQIMLHFEARDALRPQFYVYSTADHYASKNPSPNKEAFKKLVFRCQAEEISCLYELVHLKDNITGLLKQFSKTEAMSKIENENTFRLASNFVNCYKHGTRGRNQKSAYIAFWNEIIDGNDKFRDIQPVINYDGNLKTVQQVIRELISMYISFLKENTDLDISDFEKRYESVLNKEKGKKIYRGVIKGIGTWAKQETEERKKLDI